MILDTPSIDNLLVSAIIFYIDLTHITHINPDGLIFALDYIGFVNVKNFYIHSGPLYQDSHLKMTRILNGIAEDILFIATKDESLSKLIFCDDISWQLELDIGITTIQSAIDFDLNHEKVLNNIRQKVSQLEQNRFQNEENASNFSNMKQELSSLKSQLRYVFILIKILRIIKNLLMKSITAILKQFMDNINYYVKI